MRTKGLALPVSVVSKAGCEVGRPGLAFRFIPPPLPSVEWVAGDPVLDPRRRVVDEGLSISFDLQNRTEQRLRFEVRFEWTDGEGLRIETPETAWTPAEIVRRGFMPVRAFAPRSGAVRRTLDVRAPRSGGGGG